MKPDDIRASGPAEPGQLPLHVEREQLPDGRAITYYSRANDATTPSDPLPPVAPAPAVP